MQASGDAITPMRISLFCRVLHLGLCPFLIFGWWIFPRWGVSGAAVSNVISQSLAMFLGLFVLFKGRTRLQLTLKNFGLDFKIIWRIVRIGIPAALSQTGRSIGRIGMTWFMVPFGTLAVASHVLVERIEIFITLPGFGFGQSAGVLVGQNLGASQPGRAVKSTWLAVAFAESIVVVFTTVMLLFPGRVLQVFSSDPVLVELASSYLTIAVIGYLTLGIATVFAFALSGAGDTVPPMTITITNFGVQLLLAFILPRVTNLGAYGVRWAIVIGMVTAMIAYVIYFRTGRWHHKKV
jgi:putative MATE family efflux protein